MEHLLIVALINAIQCYLAWSPCSQQLEERRRENLVYIVCIIYFQSQRQTLVSAMLERPKNEKVTLGAYTGFCEKGGCRGGDTQMRVGFINIAY